MIALIDADILVYRIGFASEKDEEKYCKARVDEFIKDILMFDLFVDDCELFLTWDSSTNFRHQVATIAPYKGNRKQPKPKHYDFIRNYLVDSWGAHKIDGQEADDALAQWATRDPEGTIICSIDKDLDQVPGYHYNFVTGKKYAIDDAEGFRNFCLQVITGDRIDNIVGIRGTGPVKAARWLEDCHGMSLQLSRAAEAYRQDGDESLNRFRENCLLVWLRRNWPGQGQPELIDELLKEIK